MYQRKIFSVELSFRNLYDHEWLSEDPPRACVICLLYVPKVPEVSEHCPDP